MVLGVAPLFHITGLIAGVTVSLLLGAPLVLACRFEPSVAIETIRDERPTFTVGSITVFIALMNAPNAERDALASLTKIWSGGTPIPPSTVKAFQAQFGQYIHNVCGLTETTSPSHGVPSGAVAPVDETLLCTRATSATWTRPAGSTSSTGRRTRSNAGGYKVWPREVEDVLYQHEAVREAAVVGVPDAYRGETVKAYVSLRAGQTATAEELMAFCRQQMAAYKYPRQVEFLDELPKTVSGKLLRRDLRARN